MPRFRFVLLLGLFMACKPTTKSVPPPSKKSALHDGNVPDPSDQCSADAGATADTSSLTNGAALALVAPESLKIKSISINIDKETYVGQEVLVLSFDASDNSASISCEVTGDSCKQTLSGLHSSQEVKLDKNCLGELLFSCKACADKTTEGSSCSKPITQRFTYNGSSGDSTYTFGSSGLSLAGNNTPQSFDHYTMKNGSIDDVDEFITKANTLLKDPKATFGDYLEAQKYIEYVKTRLAVTIQFYGNAYLKSMDGGSCTDKTSKSYQDFVKVLNSNEPVILGERYAALYGEFLKQLEEAKSTSGGQGLALACGDSSGGGSGGASDASSAGGDSFGGSGGAGGAGGDSFGGSSGSGDSGGDSGTPEFADSGSGGNGNTGGVNTPEPNPGDPAPKPDPEKKVEEKKDKKNETSPTQIVAGIAALALGSGLVLYAINEASQIKNGSDTGVNFGRFKELLGFDKENKKFREFNSFFDKNGEVKKGKKTALKKFFENSENDNWFKKQIEKTAEKTKAGAGLMKDKAKKAVDNAEKSVTDAEKAVTDAKKAVDNAGDSASQELKDEVVKAKNTLKTEQDTLEKARHKLEEATQALTKATEKEGKASSKFGKGFLTALSDGTFVKKIEGAGVEKAKLENIESLIENVKTPSKNRLKEVGSKRNAIFAVLGALVLGAISYNVITHEEKPDPRKPKPDEGKPTESKPDGVKLALTGSNTVDCLAQRNSLLNIFAKIGAYYPTLISLNTDLDQAKFNLPAASK